jgi:hypothetical protein
MSKQTKHCVTPAEEEPCSIQPLVLVTVSLVFCPSALPPFSLLFLSLLFLHVSCIMSSHRVEKQKRKKHVFSFCFVFPYTATIQLFSILFVTRSPMFQILRPDGHTSEPPQNSVRPDQGRPGRPHSPSKRSRKGQEKAMI